MKQAFLALALFSTFALSSPLYASGGSCLATVTEISNDYIRASCDDGRKIRFKTEKLPETFVGEQVHAWGFHEAN